MYRLSLMPGETVCLVCPGVRVSHLQHVPNKHKTGLQVDGGENLIIILAQCSRKAEINQHKNRRVIAFNVSYQLSALILFLTTSCVQIFLVSLFLSIHCYLQLCPN